MGYTICKAVETALETRELHYMHEDDTFDLFVCEDKAIFKIRIIAERHK